MSANAINTTSARTVGRLCVNATRDGTSTIQRGDAFRGTATILNQDAGCDKNVKPKPGDCPSSSPSKWAHECDCRLYYQCESGKKKLYDCSWGNYFNIANLKCDVASKVNCKNNWDDWV
ncbi:uncharacterized protein LOC112461430 [Temnothorax curvispinosus]|nr:uncharacterized protein LOC112461430 [Temnothorax curvispinosus]